jgi:biopolymer transport protein TolQ
MNAFRSIAIRRTPLWRSSPRSPRPFATAIGLITAIPAYIAFNAFSTAAGRFSGRLEGFADDLSTAIQRRLAEKV